MGKNEKRRRKAAPAKPEKKQEYIFRSWRRTPSGKILYARDFGLRAWKIPVSE